FDILLQSCQERGWQVVGSKLSPGWRIVAANYSVSNFHRSLQNDIAAISDVVLRHWFDQHIRLNTASVEQLTRRLVRGHRCEAHLQTRMRQFDGLCAGTAAAARF